MEDVFIQFEYHWRFGSRIEARKIAAEWVESHAESLEQLEHYKPEGIVWLAEKYRAAGQEENRIAVDMWLVNRNMGPIGESKVIPREQLPDLPVINPEAVQEFRATWKLGTQAAREDAKEIAKTYVANHKADFEPILMRFTLEDLVQIAGSYRAYQDNYNYTLTEMWLLSEYKPQTIIGQFDIGVADMVKRIRSVSKGAGQ